MTINWLKSQSRVFKRICFVCWRSCCTTPLNQPVLNNVAYWYLSDLKSFGFAPNYNILQFHGDGYDCDYDILGGMGP